MNLPEDPFAPHPLGDAATVLDHRSLAPLSEAASEAADNLLRKAARALAEGDEGRAERFVARAVAIPYDRREQMVPAAFSAVMMLFDLVGDAAEEGDPRWLDAALEVLPDQSGWGRTELLVTLRSVRDDYGLERREARAITAALAGTGELPQLQDAALEPAELAGAVREVLQVVVAYVAALEGAAPGGGD